MARQALNTNTAKGFSLLEVLVALVITGLLMAMLAKGMGQVIQTSQAIDEELGFSREAVVIRTLLHRDLQSMQELDDLGFGSSGMTIRTSHSLLSDHPLPVSVVWTFTGDTVTRSESMESSNFQQNLTLGSGFTRWDIELYLANENRWTTLSNWLLDFRRDPAQLRALRITLGHEEGRPMIILERLPHDLTLG